MIKIYRIWIVINRIIYHQIITKKEEDTTLSSNDNSNNSANSNLSDETLNQINAKNQAESYLRISAFSEQELIEQLEYEGFTYEQALYGVEQNGY